MIVDGLKLTVLGMSVVFLFLALLIAAIQLSARLLKPLSDREALVAASGRTRGGPAAAVRDQGTRTMAVIAAAIAAHRSSRKRR